MTRLNDAERTLARSVHARPSVDSRYWDAAIAAIADRDDLLDAINTTLDALLDFACESGEHLTCSEIESLAALYRVAGREDDAAAILAPESSHVYNEEEDDQHYIAGLKAEED